MSLWSPPTDNLYKFLAIAALVVAAFYYHTSSTARSEMLKASREFFMRETERHKKVSRGYIDKIPAPSFRPFQMEFPGDVNYVFGGAEDRRKWTEFLSKESEKALSNTAPLNTKDDMKEYFQRPNVQGYFRLYKNMSEAEYTKMVEAMTLEKFFVKWTPFCRPLGAVYLLSA